MFLYVFIVTTVGYKPLIVREYTINQVTAGRTNASVVFSHDSKLCRDIFLSVNLCLYPGSNRKSIW